jgi:hypothetical protein
MRHRLGVAFLSALLLGLSASAASAATIQDLIKLKAAGLSDDILIALIQSDGSVFKMNADDVIAVRKEGLSEKVIMAMLSTAIKPVTVAPKPVAVTKPSAETPPTPLVQVNDPSGQQTYYGESNAPDTQALKPEQKTAPVVINVTQKVEQTVEDSRSRNPYADAYAYYPPGYNPYLPLYTTFPVFVARPAVPAAPAAPVFWGFNGQRRPDTWRAK